jgi:transketolase
MRNSACATWRKLFSEHRFAFLSGDLGFMALEPLRDDMGPWFINAGVAEQNMMSVAAGMTKMGIETWVYSIAPFIYARPFEQIRNDVCLNNLPVRIVGNGGGYAYGSMGSSHHAIEDYGVMLALQGMNVLVPAFAEDVEPAIRYISATDKPAYLRLGRCEKPAEFPVAPFAPWRLLVQGEGPLLIAVGPLVGSFINRILALESASRPELWVLSEMPAGLDTIPEDIICRVKAGATFAVAEEHVAHGSAGQALVATMAKSGASPRNFIHFCAQGYPSGNYGSQSFHRKECGLDVDSVLARLSTESKAQ